MKTLNYWLGVLTKCQLFGHGVKKFIIQDTNGKRYEIGPVEVTEEEVIVHIA